MAGVIKDKARHFCQLLMWGVNRFVTFLLEWAGSRGLENSCDHGQRVTFFTFDILTNPSVKASLICHTPFPRKERTNERHRKELAAWSYTLLPHNNFGMAPFCSSPPNSALRTLQKEICHISNLYTTQDFQFTFEHNSRFRISHISNLHLNTTQVKNSGFLRFPASIYM